ncbi:hypothetical protein CBR_g84658, partial [Chara braunii]
TPHNNS